MPAAIADATGVKRGLLDAPLGTSASESEGPPPAAHVAEDGHSPLRDNLLGDDRATTKEALEEGEEEKIGLLTTVTARGSRLAVEDVSVITPTGGLLRWARISQALRGGGDGLVRFLLFVGE